MTLPRPRREIEVDRVRYTWTHRSAAYREPAGVVTETTILVEPQAHPGRLARATFRSDLAHPPAGRFKYADFVAISPRLVAEVVRTAVRRGWTPGGAGTAPFVVEVGPELEALVRAIAAEHRPAGEWAATDKPKRSRP